MGKIQDSLPLGFSRRFLSRGQASVSTTCKKCKKNTTNTIKVQIRDGVSFKIHYFGFCNKHKNQVVEIANNSGFIVS